MQSRTSVFNAETPLSRLFWTCIAAVALIQIAAIYLVCKDQVQRAQARDAGAQMRQVALVDCLQNSVDSTIGSCFAQLRQSYDDGASAVASGIAASPARAAMTEAGAFTLPAHFSFR